MSDDFDGRIDGELRRAGEQWRSRRPVSASVDRYHFTEQNEPKRSWLPAMASAVGVLALLAVGVLIVLSLPPANPNVASGSPSPPIGSQVPATLEPTAAPAVDVIVSGRGELDCGGGEGGCATFFGVDDEEWRMEYREDPFPRVTLPDGQFVRLEPGDHRLVAHMDAVSDVRLNGEEPQHSVVGFCETRLHVETSMALLTVEIAFQGEGPCEIDAYPLNPTAPLPDLSPLPPVAPTSVDVLGTRWDRYGAESLPPGVGEFDSLVTSGGRILATVHGCPSDRGPCTYMLLSTLDGTSWTLEAQIARGINSKSEIRMFSDPEVGFIAAAGVFYDGPRAGLWHSLDGTNWDWVGNQASFDVPECESIDSFEVFDVYRAGDQLVAQARVYCGTKVFFRTWSSTDGRAWDRIDHVPAAAVVENHGVFVGISGTLRENELRRSDDGLEWQIALDTEMQIVVAPIASGFVAVGGREGQNPVVLTSGDGRSWTEHPDALNATALGLLGSDGTRAAFVVESGPAAVWISSPDGQTWTAYPLPDQFSADSALATVLGDTVVVASFGEPTFWVAQVADMPGE